MAERTVSIAEARARLPGLVREAEEGSAVEITRRGRPVAVLLSSTAYYRLSSRSPSFGEAMDRFLHEADLERNGLEREDLADLRDRDAGREVGL